jgi:RNA polymerase sigma-70 factor, ECF subfamily
METTLPLPDGIVEAWYIEHAPALRRRLTTLTRDGDVAEDLTQEAFVRLVIEVRAGRAPDDPGAWLNRVGHNLAMSHGRRVMVADRHRSELVARGVGASPERLVVDAAEQREVVDVVADLPDDDRLALVLAAHGYRGPEIARRLKRTDAATRTLLCRARAKVRDRVLAGSAA